MVYIRKSGIVASLIVLVSFILVMICLLAGTSPKYLDDYGMINFNVTGIKIHADDFEVDEIIQFIRTNVSDFYTIHVGKYCNGDFNPDGSKNVTDCVDLDNFDPLAMLSDKLNKEGDEAAADLTGIADMVVKVGKKISGISIGVNLVYYLYCISVAVIGVALVGAIAGIFCDGKISATLNILVDLLAFAIVAVASALANFVAVAVPAAVNLFNNIDGDKTDGLSATDGTGFLALTWVATLLMFVASIAWCVACCSKRRHTSRGPSPHYSTAETIEYQTTYAKRSSA